MSHSTQVEDIITLRVLQPITISATFRKKNLKNYVNDRKFRNLRHFLSPYYPEVWLHSEQYTMENFVFKTETFYAILYSNLQLNFSYHLFFQHSWIIRMFDFRLSEQSLNGDRTFYFNLHFNLAFNWKKNDHSLVWSNRVLKFPNLFRFDDLATLICDPNTSYQYPKNVSK